MQAASGQGCRHRHGRVGRVVVLDAGRLAYITAVSGRPEARLYDRCARMIDTLPELNSLGPITNIGITDDGYILFAAVGDVGQRRVVLYLRPSGLIDPLPEVNLPGADVTF